MTESKLYFEDLSNEIFMEIFDYLYGQHIVFAFSDLNSRFYSVCLHYSNYHIDTSDDRTFTNKWQINHLLHFIYAKHIRSLKFSWEQRSRHFLTESLSSLCSLIFINIKYPGKIRRLLERLPSPHFLHHLSLTFNSNSKSDRQAMATTILKLPSLSKFELHSNLRKLGFDTTTQASLSLRYFSVICYETNQFLKLVSLMPNLINLNLSYNSPSWKIVSIEPNSLSKLKSLQMNYILRLDDISHMFRLCPKLKIFKAQCNSVYDVDSVIKATSWEELLSPMRFLQKVDITVYIHDKNVIDLLEYQTDFWIQRRWKAIVYNHPTLWASIFCIKSHENIHISAIFFDHRQSIHCT